MLSSTEKKKKENISIIRIPREHCILWLSSSPPQAEGRAAKAATVSGGRAVVGVLPTEARISTTGLFRLRLQACPVAEDRPCSHPRRRDSGGHVSSWRAQTVPFCSYSPSEPGLCDYLQLGLRVGGEHGPRQVYQLDVHPERGRAREALLHVLGVVFAVSFRGPGVGLLASVALNLTINLFIEIQRLNDSCIFRVKANECCIWFSGYKIGLFNYFKLSPTGKCSTFLIQSLTKPKSH